MLLKMLNCSKKINHQNDAIYEIELAKAETEHKEPLIDDSFILYYAKLRMLELYYNFFTEYCDSNMFEELEIYTDSLHPLLLPWKNSKTVSDQKWKQSESTCSQSIAPIILMLMQLWNSFPESDATSTKTWQRTTWTLQKGIDIHIDVLLI